MPQPNKFTYRSLEALKEDVARRGLEVGFDDDVSCLAEPLTVGNHEVPNRLGVLPMEGCDGTADGRPGDLTRRRYVRFAQGGSGLLWFEAVAVERTGRANPRQLWLHKDDWEDFARLREEAVAAAREVMGPDHVPFTVIQLVHSGRYSRPIDVPRPVISHHCPYLDPVAKIGPDYPVITDDELEALEDAYVAAARLAQRAGFTAVDLKVSHRYLGSELLAGFTRPGLYGGSFENRTRFLLNTVRKVRDRVPGLTIVVRLGVYDGLPYPWGWGAAKDGFTGDPAAAPRDLSAWPGPPTPPGPTATPDLTEPIRLARLLRDAGVALINVTMGNPYFAPHVTRPHDQGTAGQYVPEEHPLIGVNRHFTLTREIQRAVPEIPVAGSGYSWLRQFVGQAAAHNVRQGWVALAGMGRQAFAYPEYARDLLEKGRLEPKRSCVTCSQCTQIMRDGGQTGCVTQDKALYRPIYLAGRERATKR
ncbi:MAG: oxidoreductase [Bacillota bacterium]